MLTFSYEYFLLCPTVEKLNWNATFKCWDLAEWDLLKTITHTESCLKYLVDHKCFQKSTKNVYYACNFKQNENYHQAFYYKLPLMFDILVVIL